MKLIHTLVLSAFLLLVGTPSGQASVIVYNLILGGNQSVPANASTASGTAMVTVDDILNSVSVVLSFTGLSGNATAAHIHCCVATSANGPVVIPFTGFPSATSGTYSNTFNGVSAANIAGINAGLAYINIHNQTFPGGEIRGDIVATPEPATVSLFGLGALILLGHARRRAKG